MCCVGFLPGVALRRGNGVAAGSVSQRHGYASGTGRRARTGRRPRVVMAAEQSKERSSLDEPAIKFFAELPIKKVFLWAVFLGVLYAMRSFFPVMLGTFIVGYIGNSFVQYFQEKTNFAAPRKAIVAAYYSLIISLVALFGLTTIPKFISEGQYFVTSLQSSNPYALVADAIRSSMGEDASLRVERFLISNQAQQTAESIEEIDESTWTEERSRRLGKLMQQTIRPYAISTASVVTKLLGQTTKVLLTALISLVFSAMIVWDLPRLSSGVSALAQSRAREAYEEIAPYVKEFFTVLGRSFEAQAMIALVNTTLSTIGIIVLGLSGVWFQSVVVLVCSFIPVAGVFVSTLPMVVVALSEYGIRKATWVIIMVIGVHAVEAYFLNPQIYSAHLSLHPLFVLVVLYMWEHLYGALGMVLAVPVTVYLLRNILLGTSSPPEDAGKLAEAGAQASTEPEPQG